MKYRVQNTTSGLDLGAYDAGSEDAALDAMARDAGYASFDDVPNADRSDLDVTEVEDAPAEKAERITVEWVEVDTGETPNPIYNSVEEIPSDVLAGAKDAVICLSNEDEVDASKNENGWAAYGTTPDGNAWETDDYASLAEVVEHLMIFQQSKIDARREEEQMHRAMSA